MNILELIKVQKVENVLMLDKYGVKHTLGTFYLTETHFIFMGPNGKKKIWVLNTHVSTIEKLPLLTNGYPLHIKCKNFFIATFVIPKEKDCHEVYTTLQRLSSPTRVDDLYCFDYKGSNDDVTQETGWDFFNIQDEFQRQGVPNNEWSITYLNVNYELCESYPKYLYVPSTCSNSVLTGSAKFRSKGRLPVLTYLYKNKASICRCSQPLSGFNARCVNDEQMLHNLVRTNPNSKYLYVVDTRPRINAMANRAAGKGYENENFYDNIKFQFFGIENIHVMRSSLNKLLELQKHTSMSAFLSGLENCGWLKHIKAILETSWFIAQNLFNGISVVVHCSDGWDRTAQVCSLAALMLDPYYRTINGFQILVEKDWLSFGHKFNDRCGFIISDVKELAPIFTQFIDATYQLLQQNPYMFEFNQEYLIALHDQVHSCRYGTFVGNCEKDRQFYKLSEKTWSVWGYMSNHISEFINPFYSCDINKDKLSTVLRPKLYPQNIILWRNLYYRFEHGIHPRETFTDCLSSIFNHTVSLERHIWFLGQNVHKLGELNKASTSCPSLTPKYKFDDSYFKECFKTKSNLTNDEEHKIKLIFDELLSELNNVALEWIPLRNMIDCKCGTTFDAFNKKHHCWRCGNVVCQRCKEIIQSASKNCSIERSVPTCKFCSQNSPPPTDDHS